MSAEAAQAVVLPAPAAAIHPTPLSHVPSTALLQLQDGTVWLLKASGHLWTANRMDAAARALSRSAATPTAGQRQRQVAADLQLPSLEIHPAHLDGEVERSWPLARVCEAVIARAQRTRPDSDVETAALQASLKAALSRAIAEFRQSLDEETLSLARRADGQVDWSLYNYLVHRTHRTYRRQFAATLPILLRSVATPDRLPAIPGLGQIVDEGRPLIEAISASADVSGATVRALIGRTPAHVGQRWESDPLALLRALDALVPEARPRHPTEWACFNQAIDEQRASFGNVADARVLARAWLRERLSPRNIHRTAGGTHPAPNREQILSVLAFRDAMISAVCWHMDGERPGAGVAAQDRVSALVHNYLEDRTFRRLIRLAHEWQQLRAGVRPASAPHDPPGTEPAHGDPYWPLMPAPFHSGDGTRRIEAITTPGQLVEHGRALDLCLASFARHGYETLCQRGDAWLVALRETTSGQPMSVAEMLVIKPRRGVQITVLPRQHRAYRNRPPAHECVEALAEFITSLRLPQAQRHLEAGLATQAQRASAQQAFKVRQLGAPAARAMREAAGPVAFDALVAQALAGGQR